jgi:hypothetical protein
MSKLESEFKKAGKNAKRFRAAPFWSWNDDLKIEELRRQVGEFKKAGLGGHFMHSRPGLITPYLGRKWMDCVRATIEESKKVGLDPWLYDEDCWPSGDVGGAVQELGEDYWAKQIVLVESEAENFISSDRSLAIFAGEKVGKKIRNARRLSAGEVARGGQEERVFNFVLLRDRSYVDLLSAKVTDAFLKLGYQPYQKAVGKEFGRAVPGIFTDEPGYRGFAPPAPAAWGDIKCTAAEDYRGIPWTEELPAAFQAKWGYDLLENLLAVFYRVGDWQRVRHDFWSMITDLLVNNFTRRVYEWCDRRGLLLTGHMLSEDTLNFQIQFCGAVMPHYRWMHWPGVDCLQRRMTDAFLDKQVFSIDHQQRRLTDPLLNKQVSSVARQLGRSRVLSESFAGAGWNMSLEDMKWVWDWQAVQGVNFLCQHISQYSLKGLRKRDYPPSIHYQQPWWPDYRIFNDYIARLGTALASGRATTDTLVIYPIESAWCLFDLGDLTINSDLNNRLISLTEKLLRNARDFDFGDESILSVDGKVEGDKLRVGEGSYKVVIIPPSVSLRATTLALLERFLASGGKVIFVGGVPTRVDGRSSPAIRKRLLPRARQIAEADTPGLLRLLNTYSPRLFRLRLRKHESRIYSCERALEDGRSMWFFANLDRNQRVNTTLEIRGSGSLQAWDLMDGEIRDYPVKKGKSGLAAELFFERASSRLLVFNPQGKPTIARRTSRKILRRQALLNKWQLRRSEPNLLTLDYCQYRAGDGDWSELLPTIEVHDRVLELPANRPLEIRYRFQIACDPSALKNLCLLLEQPERYSLRLNGQRLSNRDYGWWCDIAFRKIKISDAVRSGENLLELRTKTPSLPPPSPYAGRLGARDQQRTAKLLEVESCYLLGEFNVVEKKPGAAQTPTKFALLPATATVKTGDLGAQGLTFYRGGVTYSQQIEGDLKRGERAWLEFSALEGIVFKVKVNGKKAGVFAWKPWKIEITQWLQKGTNRLEIEVIGSCRNMLGPHHNIVGELSYCHPDYFQTKDVWDNNRLIWTHHYCFVPFGITGPVRIIYENA